MFGSKKKSDTAINTSIINTIIGNNSKIEGVLSASESTRIDGLLEGKIVSESSVIVGESGKVCGDITAVEILVAGTVYGNLVAKERIEMTSTGRVLGDLITKTLVIDEGASFKGNCTMDVMGENSQSQISTSSNIHTPQENTREEKQNKHKKEEPAKENNA
ncbi:MAG: polymer-forming cytoskeletal protein [Hungatella sp.]|nr:polymer-forming cytoskeletal protein [Hungatella sp.]